MRVEVITDPQMAPRGKRILEAMIKASPIPVRIRQRYIGDCDLVMMYGLGHKVRRPWWLQHLKKGGRCIGWDLGYWKHKADNTCRMRVTINQDHPQQWLQPEPPDRWEAEQIALRDDYSATGPIVLVGLGIKSVRALGRGPLGWESAALKKLRVEYPGREIVFRPKRDTDPRMPGLRVVTGSIEEAIKGASLVVCRHSNVAVDACIAGVPVICEDGAARALYSKTQTPSIEQRLQFLQSLAYWSWKPEEASAAWSYLLRRIAE